MLLCLQTVSWLKSCGQMVDHKITLIHLSTEQEGSYLEEPLNDGASRDSHANHPHPKGAENKKSRIVPVQFTI